MFEKLNLLKTHCFRRDMYRVERRTFLICPSNIDRQEEHIKKVRLTALYIFLQKHTSTSAYLQP